MRLAMRGRYHTHELLLDGKGGAVMRQLPADARDSSSGDSGDGGDFVHA